MNKLYYPTLTHLHDRDGRPTGFGESQTDISGRLDHSSQHAPSSASTLPSPDDSTRRSEKARVNGWGGRYSPSGGARGGHGRHLDARLHTLRPPGR